MRSSGKRVSFNCLDNLDGYGGKAGNFDVGGGGGMVDAGFGEVNAKTRAEATLSAKVLNSATGVMLPRSSISKTVILRICEVSHALDVDCTTHHYNFFHSQKGFRVLCSCQC